MKTVLASDAWAALLCAPETSVAREAETAWAGELAASDAEELRVTLDGESRDESVAVLAITFLARTGPRWNDRQTIVSDR